jgi:hypothetical protein
MSQKTSISNLKQLISLLKINSKIDINAPI